MPEAVRLLIWDLDETFWKGTITEGGISAYSQEHHDLVIKLARRGIISSICSKNDEAPTLAFLHAKGIRDYFVFPSISWEPKGARIAALIETAQLRPATVMFIDDNPSNRAEAAAFVPDLQIEDETFIARMLDDPRFTGKDDSSLTRLGQYRLLETRKSDEKKAGGDNAAFLRSCDIRVHIEYDVQKHLGRAIELITRTNQLNFTKQHLPAKPEHARTLLARHLSNFRSKAGLVRVVDTYGDYGFVGFFFVRRNNNPNSAGDILHYCFSCRTLGMQVERFVYDWLGRPDLTVSGEVLTDLSAPVEIDWLRFGDETDAAGKPIDKTFDLIRIHGGCEATAIAHYLQPHASAVQVTSNFASGGCFVGVHGTSLLLSACERAGPAFHAECEAMDLPYDLMTCDFLDPIHENALFIFSAELDSVRGHRYRHRQHGWEIRITPHGMPGANLLNGPEEKVLADLKATVKPEHGLAHVLKVAAHLRQNYELAARQDDDELLALNRQMLELLPKGARFVFVLSSARLRDREGTIKTWPIRERYNDIIQEVVSSFPFATVALFDDAIEDDSEIQFGGNHYHRMVYLRLAEDILAKATQLPAKVEVCGKMTPTHATVETETT